MTSSPRPFNSIKVALKNSKKSLVEPSILMSPALATDSINNSIFKSLDHTRDKMYEDPLILSKHDSLISQTQNIRRQKSNIAQSDPRNPQTTKSKIGTSTSIASETKRFDPTIDDLEVLFPQNPNLFPKSVRVNALIKGNPKKT